MSKITYERVVELEGRVLELQHKVATLESALDGHQTALNKTLALCETNATQLHDTLLEVAKLRGHSSP